MFTVCPKCALTLVVTAADLRVAQGYVRCGRCSSVFNAIARLSEERGAIAAAAGAPAVPAAAQEGPASPPANPAAAETAEAAFVADAAAAAEENEAALEFNPDTDVNSVFVQAPLDPQWTAATGSFKALVAASEASPTAAPAPAEPVDVEIDAEDFAAMLNLEPAESVVPKPAPIAAPAASGAASAAAVPAPAQPAAETAAPQGPRPPASTGPGPQRPTRAPDHQTTHARPDTHASPRPPRAPPAGPAAEQPGSEPGRVPQAVSAQEIPDSAALAPAEPQPALRAPAWTAAAALALLVLLAQILNHYRDDLAASARFNHALSKVYGALGIKLFPHWDLRAYDVRQLGAEADPVGAGVITVRASIKNAAAEPQPLPLLRVTLQDRFGNRIAMRDVAPHSYLPQSIPPSSFLAAGQRIDAQMGFADPGTDAVGFEIDACLPARGGVTCANDAALR
jgi:predicted Zn finger-like uncharacterized protein